MSINQRMRQLRNVLGLSTRAFGKTLGLSGSVISNMENNRRNITERTIHSVCREHNVNKDWLKDGVCPMFLDPYAELDIDDDVKALTSQYALLSDANKTLVRNLIDSLVEKA